MEQTPARVHGVVSFYTMFNMKPIGRHHIQVCRTLSCALRGAEKMTAFIKQKLGIEIGQTTADGRFTLSEVECFASCGTAPMMQVNDEYYENLNRRESSESFWNNTEIATRIEEPLSVVESPGLRRFYLIEMEKILLRNIGVADSHTLATYAGAGRLSLLAESRREHEAGSS